MIRLEDVHRIFEVGSQRVHALSSVNLAVESGEYVSIMGPSGSGKSTVLNVVGLLDRPTRGRYFLGGRDVTTLSEKEQANERRTRIGFIFQFFHLVPRLSATENIELPMILAGLEPRERRARVQRTLEAFGLTDRADHRPDQLSGGQRQRVAIARATILEPQVLLADEPTGNLDRHAGHEILDLLEGLHQQGITLIVVTHDPEIGGRAARRVRMLDGNIVEDSRADAGPREGQ